MNISSKIILTTIIVVATVIVIKYKTIETYAKCPLIIPNKNIANIRSFIPASLYNITRQKIPKIIVQTNEHQTVPVDMLKSINTIVRNNPDYSYIYYDNEDARNFIIENYPRDVVKTYDKLIPGAFKADLFRYCFLYKMGGVYIDTSMMGLAPLSTIVLPLDEFVSAEDNGTQGIYNAIMASIPNHPILKTAIEMCVYNITTEYYGNSPLDITGPMLLAKAFKKVTGAAYIKPDIRYSFKESTGLISMVSFIKTDDCTGSGIISLHGKACLQTKYPTYYADAKWYNTNEHYSRLWDRRMVYKTC